MVKQPGFLHTCLPRSERFMYRGMGKQEMIPGHNS